MVFTEQNLASRLHYLPLDITEKVLLWLTYKGLKPVSEITAERRGNIRALLKKGVKPVSKYNFDSKDSKRIRKWLADASLNLEISPDYKTEWHVGKDKDLVHESTILIRRFDRESEIRSGEIFGFPKDSTVAYAENKSKPIEEIQQVMVGTGGIQFDDPYLHDRYFAPYVLYNMPKSDVVSESRTAQLWADTIRADVPKLAQWFEAKYTSKKIVNNHQ